MNNIKLFVMAPIMPSIDGIEFIKKTISSLNLNFNYQVFDPLKIQSSTTADFLNLWQAEIEKKISDGTKVFLGFSFGAVILNTILSKIKNKNLKLILVSMPLPIIGILKQRLNTVLKLCQENETKKALELLYKDVYAPKKVPANLLDNLDLIVAQKRLTTGFTLLFKIEKLYRTANKVAPTFLHLSGQQSQLVETDNLLIDTNIKNIIVPKSGMKVLDDNKEFCKQVIKNYIEKLND